MDVVRLAIVAVVSFGFASPLALADSDQERAAAQAKEPPKPWKHVRGYGRVLDLRTLPLIIDKSGLYAIDRDWQLPDSAESVSANGLIQITAADVTLDLHGFEIDSDPGNGTLLVISGTSAEVRNGKLTACCTDGARAVRATSSANLHHLSVYSYDVMEFDVTSRFADSEIVARVGLSFAGGARVERNVINCNFACITVLGDDGFVLNNRVMPWQGGVFEIMGDRNIVADNIVDASNSIDVDDPFEIGGDRNVVRNNTVIPGGELRAAFSISGTANTLDGNISAPPNPTGRAPVGMAFTADGNFYGDNRMAARVPFDLGATVQADWGGNVGY